MSPPLTCCHHLSACPLAYPRPASSCVYRHLLHIIASCCSTRVATHHHRLLLRPRATTHHHLLVCSTHCYISPSSLLPPHICSHMSPCRLLHTLLHVTTVKVVATRMLHVTVLPSVAPHTLLHLAVFSSAAHLLAHVTALSPVAAQMLLHVTLPSLVAAHLLLHLTVFSPVACRNMHPVACTLSHLLLHTCCYISPSSLPSTAAICVLYPVIWFLSFTPCRLCPLACVL